MEQPLDYVTQGSIKYVVSRRLFMASSKIQGRGLRSSALPSLALIFTSVIQITLSSFDTQSPV